MAGKTPGTPRKSSSKKATEKAKNTVTSISQGNSNMSENKKFAPQREGVEEEIRQRAYELYEERGRQHGFHHEDWSRAETEVLSRFQREKSA